MASTVTKLGLVVAVLILATSLAIEAQHTGKVYRIGVLEIVDVASNAANLNAFRQGLADLGYVEGQNFVIEYRSAEGRPERFLDLATELVRLKVDVGPPELGGKRLQLLKEAVPGSSRIGILWNPDLYTPLIVRDTERVARAMGVQLKSLEMQRSEPFEQVFETALFGQVDALIAVEDQLTFTYRARILEFAAMSRLPAIYGLREFVDAGGLMSYGTDRRDLYRRCATYVHRILTGASPADLPVEPPIKFELAINLKTARTLGLTIPPALLLRPDYVIQ
jgi:putative ABC transport system substrate-binding protein